MCPPISSNGAENRFYNKQFTHRNVHPRSGLNWFFFGIEKLKIRAEGEWEKQHLTKAGHLTHVININLHFQLNLNRMEHIQLWQISSKSRPKIKISLKPKIIHWSAVLASPSLFFFFLTSSHLHRPKT